MGEPEGGLGGTTGRGIRDTRLVERALRERWPIPKALRGPLIDRLAGIVQDPEAALTEEQRKLIGEDDDVVVFEPGGANTKA